MFVYNYDNSALVNVNHIIRLSLEAPQFEAKDHRVIASLTYGTSILFRGTREECAEYMEDFRMLQMKRV